MIGAGIAGLAAAQQMQQFGLEVIVLEARVSLLPAKLCFRQIVRER